MKCLETSFVFWWKKVIISSQSWQHWRHVFGSYLSNGNDFAVFSKNIIIHLCLLVGFAHQLYSRFIYFPNMEQNDFYRKINELGNGIGSRKARGTNECNFFWSLLELKFGTKDLNEYSVLYLSHYFPIFTRMLMNLRSKKFRQIQ